MFSICLFLVTWPLPDLFRLPFKGRREAGGEEEERREREREKKILLVKIIPLSSKVGTLSPVPGSQGSHVRCVCVGGGCQASQLTSEVGRARVSQLASLDGFAFPENNFSGHVVDSIWVPAVLRGFLGKQYQRPGALGCYIYLPREDVMGTPHWEAESQIPAGLWFRQPGESSIVLFSLPPALSH